MSEFLAYLGVFGKLDVVVRLILHDDGVQVNVVTHLELGDIDVGFPAQRLGGVQVPDNTP